MIKCLLFFAAGFWVGFVIMACMAAAGYDDERSGRD